MGRNNGTAKSPECGGLSIEDLEVVDLSKADFREFYDEVVIPNINIPDVKVDGTSKAKDTEVSKMPSEHKGFNEKSLKEGM